MPLVPSCLSNIEKYFLSVDDCSTVLDDYSVVMSVVPSYVVSVGVDMKHSTELTLCVCVCVCVCAHVCVLSNIY